MAPTTPDPLLEPDATAPAGQSRVSRRTVLRIAAVSGAGAALLAACGGNDSTADPGTSGPTAEAPGTEGSDGSGATDSPGGTLVAAADVPVGRGVILEDQKIVVTQPSAGEFKAFTAVCTHSQCTVTSVKKNTINCRCHGSAFSAADGSVKNGPARSPLREIPVSVEGDEVVRA